MRRQPFGGWKRSSIGSGTKPGGPDHLHSYGTWTRTAKFSDANGQNSDLELPIADYQRAWDEYFALEHDPTGLACESNALRYLPLDRVIVRIDNDNVPEAHLLCAAADTAGVPIEFSTPDTETDHQLANRLSTVTGEVRLRILTEIADDVLKAAHSAGVTIDESVVTGIGRLDLLRFVKEQSISRTMHRYGRLITK